MPWSVPEQSDVDAATRSGVSSRLADASIRYETRTLPRSIVHLVWIPASAQADIAVTLSEDLATVEQQARASGAIAALNAGFFDPQNQQTTSYVVVDGELVADPRENQRLVGNPDLAPYMDAILNRSEFRQYRCVEGDRHHIRPHIRLDITAHRAPIPEGCTVHHAVGAGPQLLPSLQSEDEGFVTYSPDGRVVRDAIGSLAPNARSAVGLTADGTLVLVMAAQRADVEGPTGLSLPELADVLASLGVERSLNLDGGSSASLYYDGTMQYGRLNSEGQPVERPVKSVILIRSGAALQE